MGKKIQLEKRYSKWGYIFIIPFLLIFLVFHFWPLASTVYYAFCYLKHAGNTNPQFLPLIGQPWYKNFVEIFGSRSFHDAFRNTFLFWIGETVPQWILAFWLAVMLTDRRIKMKGRILFKTAFFFPKLVPGTIWEMIGIIQVGAGMFLMASMMNGFGIMPEDMEIFSSVQFLIIVVTVFFQFGITVIYAIAGITGIPVEIFEAAEIDGANRIQTFFRVTIPCMRPMMFFITVVTIVDGLGMIDIPSVFGLFDTFRRNLTLMQYLENQAFLGSYAYDRASAASVILLIIYGIIAWLVYFFLLRDKDEARLRRQIRKERREEKHSVSGL